MREIKFRAWDAKNKKFPKTFIGFHVTGECSAFDLLNQYSLEEFCELEIQQFTGLTDKRGIDIYEGDILQCRKGFRYTVFWLDTEASFELSYLDDEKMPEDYSPVFHWRFALDAEIIGNIFENEELLK